MNLRKRKKVNYKQDEYNFPVHNDPTFDVGPQYEVFYHPDVKNNYLEQAIEPDHDFFDTISAPYYDDDKIIIQLLYVQQAYISRSKHLFHYIY